MANTLERLREVRDAALAGESYWIGGDLMPVRISELEALLAVVEAAKAEHDVLHPIYVLGRVYTECPVCAALANLYEGK